MSRQPDYDRVTLYFKGIEGGKQNQVYKMLKTLAGSTTDIITSVFGNVLGEDLWLDFEHMERGDVQEMIMRHLFEIGMGVNSPAPPASIPKAGMQAAGMISPAPAAATNQRKQQAAKPTAAPTQAPADEIDNDFSVPLPTAVTPAAPEPSKAKPITVNITTEDENEVDSGMPLDDDSDIPVDDGMLAMAFPGI